MTAFMGKNPEASSKQTLNNGVYSPQCCTNWGGGDVFRSNKFVEENKSGSQTGNIPSNISQTPQTRPLKAVLGNCTSNIIDGIIWDLEFVPICINELAISLLLDIVQRGHGRK